MKKKKKKNPKRRSSPNLVARSKIFANTAHLFMAKEFAKYEERQQSLREGIYVDDIDECELFIRRWAILQHLIPYPEEPSNENFKRLAYSSKVFDIHIEIDEIVNTYETFKRVVDFEPITSSKLNMFLDGPRPKGELDHILSAEEKTIVQTLVFDVEHWEDKDHNSKEDETNFWKVALSTQNEIETNGTISEKTKETILKVKTTRKNIRRPRLYATAALILMFADLYEEYNEFNKIASMSDKTYALTKKEHDAQNAEKKPELRTKWVPQYSSPFHRFMKDVLITESIESIGSATIQKLVKSRRAKKISGIKNTLLKAPQTSDFYNFFEIADKLKA